MEREGADKPVCVAESVGAPHTPEREHRAMKVLLIDDHPLILTALQDVIQGWEPTSPWSASAARARRARRSPPTPTFDLVLLDLRLGDADGFDVLVELRNGWPAMPVVVVSASDRSADVIRAIDLGAMGFVPKRASNETLAEALRVVMSGGIYVPPMTMGGSGERSRAASRRSARGHALAATAVDAVAPTALANFKLTPRQTDVLGLLLRGQSNKLIARELDLSVETVKDHVAAGAARARRQLAHAGRAGRQPDVEPGSDRAVAHAPARIERGRGRGDAPLAAADARRRPRAEAPLDSFLLLRDHVRGLFAFNRTSLAGHAVGALIVEIDLRRRRRRSSLRVGLGHRLRDRLAAARLARRCASRARADVGGRPRARGCAPGRPACSRRARSGASPPGSSRPTAAARTSSRWSSSSTPSASRRCRSWRRSTGSSCSSCCSSSCRRSPASRSAAARSRWQVAIVMAVAMGMTMLLGRNYRDSFDRDRRA